MNMILVFIAFITIVRPDADSTPLAWTPNSGLIHYNRVYEAISDENLTYVSTTKTKYKETFGMQNLFDGENPPLNSNIRIIQVTWYRRARKTTLEFPDYNLGASCFPSNWEYSVAWIEPFLTMNFVTIGHSLSQIGYLGHTRDITIDDINMVNLQLTSSIQTGSKNTIRCTQIYMEVEWEYLSTSFFHNKIN